MDVPTVQVGERGLEQERSEREELVSETNRRGGRVGGGPDIPVDPTFVSDLPPSLLLVF